MSQFADELRVRHITMVNKGGAAIAARRISEANTSVGIYSNFEAIQTPASNSKIFSRVAHRYDRKLSSTYDGGYDFSILKNLGTTIEKNSTFQIVNLHWIPGIHPFLDLQLKSQIVVQTLHDMNYLTGGCHHSLGCGEYKKSCKNCPLVRSPQRKIVELNFQARKHLETKKTLVAPSMWLKSVAEISELTKNHQIIHIPNPVPDIFFKYQSNNRPLIAQDDPIRICVLGSNYNHNKNARKVINVLNEIKGFLENEIQLNVIGEPHINSEISQVKFLKKDSDDHGMSKFLSECDLIFYASTADNLPSILIEAQAAGVAVFAIEAGGVGETFTNNLTGMLVKEDEKSIKTGIISLLNNRNQLHAFKMNSSKLAEKKFGYNTIGQEYVNLYLELISNNKKKGK